VVLWSGFLVKDPEARVRFPALQNFLRSSGSETGSTQPREYNWGATWKKSNVSGLENREYGRRDPLADNATPQLLFAHPLPLHKLSEHHSISRRCYKAHYSKLGHYEVDDLNLLHWLVHYASTALDNRFLR
jgi:hypothetical protein